MQHDELANQAGTFASAAKSSVYEILTASGISILALTASAIGLASGSGLLLPALCAAFAAMTIATGYLAARLARDLTYDLPGTRRDAGNHRQKQFEAEPCLNFHSSGAKRLPRKTALP
jgi:hypothetical protein